MNHLRFGKDGLQKAWMLCMRTLECFPKAAVQMRLELAQIWQSPSATGCVLPGSRRNTHMMGLRWRNMVISFFRKTHILKTSFRSGWSMQTSLETLNLRLHGIFSSTILMWLHSRGTNSSIWWQKTLSILLVTQLLQSVPSRMTALQFCRCIPKMEMLPLIRKKRGSALSQCWVS